MAKDTTSSQLQTTDADLGKSARRSVKRTFPASTFEDALEIALAIQKYGAGQQRIRRLTLFDQMGKSPESGSSRQLVINSGRYNLTRGGYAADYLEITPEAVIAIGSEHSPREQLKTRFHLAIDQIPPFKVLYERLKDNKLPNKAVMLDIAVETGLDSDAASECIETFFLNAKYIGIVKTLSGAERLMSLEHALDSLPAASNEYSVVIPPAVNSINSGTPIENGDAWSKICFYITPIGEEQSLERQHSDLFLSSLVEPAVEEFGLTVLRADKIGKPGMISAQVIEHVLKSRLVIADLSFHNPNVFYELCLRHATGLPVVQLIQKADSIPFDIDQFRTIQIDNSSIYALVPHLETYRMEIARQVRKALESTEPIGNPITASLPKLKLSISGI